MHSEELVHAHHAKALLESIYRSPLLLGDLPISRAFDRNLLANYNSIAGAAEFNFKQKLGLLYEEVFGFALKRSREASGLELIAQGVQVFGKNKRTQGELDFLLRLGERAIHLELAVKFYLIYENKENIRFPGPDPKDDWDTKLHKLKSHQLNMARSESGKKLLHEVYGIEDIEVQHLVYGKFFDHASVVGKRQSQVLPSSVVASSQTFPWLYLSEWSHYVGTTCAFLIPKHLWPLALSQFDPALFATLLKVDAAYCREYFTTYSGSQMVWSEKDQKPALIVSDHWPHE